MKIIGVELRLNINIDGVGRQDEILLVPLNIELPRPRTYGYWSMPCTVHTSARDENLGGQNVGQQYRLDLGESGHSPTLEEYLSDLSAVGRR